MKTRLYILEVIFFGAISIISSLAPRLLSAFVSDQRSLFYVKICSWVTCAGFGIVVFVYATKGIRNHLKEKQRQKRLLTGARA